MRVALGTFQTDTQEGGSHFFAPQITGDALLLAPEQIKRVAVGVVVEIIALERPLQKVMFLVDPLINLLAFTAGSGQHPLDDLDLRDGIEAHDRDLILTAVLRQRSGFGIRIRLGAIDRDARAA